MYIHNISEIVHSSLIITHLVNFEIDISKKNLLSLLTNSCLHLMVNWFFRCYYTNIIRWYLCYWLSVTNFHGKSQMIKNKDIIYQNSFILYMMWHLYSNFSFANWYDFFCYSYAVFRKKYSKYYFIYYTIHHICVWKLQ